MKNKLAVFDFDKTITAKDSLIDFIIYFAGKKRFLFGIIYCLKDLILYKLNLISNYHAKEAVFTYFFRGLSLNEMITAGNKYADERLPFILKPEAVEKINYHKEKNNRLVIVSASPKYWFAK